ncbi:MAG: ABC transporter ATP-binding protein [Peptoniphilaceae bacterium]|jgi:putative ABC transport system ATP-binding protein|nr:ABC transporter ATP-binding protein [Bacillota bacterium]
MLQGSALVKTFGDTQKIRVLNRVDVHVRPGEFVAVMGPSGSGKSTLLFVLSGTDRPTEGEVLFEGVPLSSLSDNRLSDVRRTKMGFVFQKPTLLRNLNILDNILLPHIADKTDRSALKEKARTLMEKTGIGGLEDRDITEVSGGQLQRAGLCRALLGDPRIVFADEPTGALNTQASEAIMDLLESVHETGTAVFLVTHDPKVAARAGRVLAMKDGQIVSETVFSQEDRATRQKSILQILRKHNI